MRFRAMAQLLRAAFESSTKPKLKVRKRKTAVVVDNVEHDSLMPDSDFRAELGGISKMTLWRWDRDAGLAEQGFPPAIRIRERSYRSRRAFELFKQNLLQQAIRDRSARLKPGPRLGSVRE
jgi:hypothetical protein